MKEALKKDLYLKLQFFSKQTTCESISFSFRYN